MLYFARWKIALILRCGCRWHPVDAAELLFRKNNSKAGRTSCRKTRWCLGSTCKAGAYLLYEVDQKDYIQKAVQGACQ